MDIVSRDVYMVKGDEKCKKLFYVDYLVQKPKNFWCIIDTYIGRAYLTKWYKKLK